MISLDDARDHVLSRMRPVAPVEAPVAAAVGATLAADVIAHAPVPPFANSAMDGIAVRAADTAPGATLRLVGTVAAGAPSDRRIEPGDAVRIMTGAPVPAGADAVVMVERCSFGVDGTGGDQVTVEIAVETGTNVRPVGDDIEPGDVVLPGGSVVTPGAAALLRTLGLATVGVRRPRVGVLSTGDELVEPPGELEPGQIYDSNRAALVALVAAAGCLPIDLGVVADDEAAIAAEIVRAADSCDALLTTGGVSMGDFDYVKAVLDRVGDMRWMQIAIKPAKPFAFGTIARAGRSVPVFGLPGNPVSSMVSFELLARPGLLAMAGRPEVHRRTVTVTAAEPMRRRRDGKVHFPRVVVEAVDGVLVARSAGGQGSHQLSAMATANALGVLPDGDGVDAGDPLDVLLVEQIV